MNAKNSQTFLIRKEILSKRRIVYKAVQRIKMKNEPKCSLNDLEVTKQKY